VIQPSALYSALVRHGFTFYTGVPDSLLRDFCAFVTDHAPPTQHVINAHEGLALSLAAGYHLATGDVAVVYLQNSGLGNLVNPLLSLTHREVYAIPALLLIGWRGEPGVRDEPQHVVQGRLTPDLLHTLAVDYRVLGADTPDLEMLVADLRSSIAASGRVHALLVRQNTFEPYVGSGSPLRPYSLTRRQAIDTILQTLSPEDVVVATTGMISREVHAYRLRNQQTAADFLTVGSMGHCSQIALGIAQHQPERQVYCLDGDGAAIMHMGSLAIVGSQQPRNFRHIVINNGAHESVGGQPTAGFHVDLAGVARACGYTSSFLVADAEGITPAIVRMRSQSGPLFLEVRVGLNAGDVPPRPSALPVEQKRCLMKAIDHDCS